MTWRIKPSTLTFLIIFFLLLVKCKKDSTDICDQDFLCNEFPITSSPLGYDYLLQSKRPVWASFSPNNDNEILFYKDNSNDEGVYIFDLNTSEMSLVFQGNLIASPEWGKNDWILLNIDGNIFKIQSNGDNFTQLTFDGGSYYPHWNINADSLIFRKNLDNLSIVMNEFGSDRDTFPEEYSAIGTSWNHSQFICNQKMEQLVLNELANETTISIKNLQEDFDLYTGCEEMIIRYYGQVWVNNDIYYSNTLGLFKSNIGGGESVMIHEGCQHVKYLYPSVNASKDKILCVKQIDEYLETNIIKTTNQVVIMDLDGQNLINVELF